MKERFSTEKGSATESQTWNPTIPCHTLVTKTMTVPSVQFEFDTPLFGRELQLSALVDGIQQQQKITLIGQSEFGTSRLVAEALQQHFQANSASHSIVCVNANSELELYSDLFEIAQRHQLRERYFRKPVDLLMGVRRWLRLQNAIVIVDHCRELNAVRQLLNGIHSARILITNTESSTPIIALSDSSIIQEAIIDVGPLDQDDALSWLHHRLKNDQCVTLSLLEKLAESANGSATVLNLFSRLVSTLNPNATNELIQKFIEHHRPEMGAVQIACDKLAQQFGENRVSTALLSLVSGENANDLDDEMVSQFSRIGLLDTDPLSQTASIPDSLRDAVRNCVQSSRLQASISSKPTSKTSLSYRTERAFQQMKENTITKQVQEEIRAVNTQLMNIGALKTAVKLLRRFVKCLTNSGSATHRELAEINLLIADCYVRCEQYSNARKQLGIANRYCDEEMDLRARIGLDLAELDLNDVQIRSAARRLVIVAGLHAQLKYHGSSRERARRLFLRGACCLATQETDDAVRVLRRAVAVQSTVYQAHEADPIRSRNLLARAYFAQNNLEEAEKLLTRSYAARSANGSVLNAELITTMNYLGDVCLRLGKTNEAVSYYEKCLKAREELLDENHHLTGETANQLAIVKSSIGDFEAADVLFRQALMIMTDRFGSKHPNVAKVNNDLAESLFTQGKHDQARRILEKTLRIQQAALRPNAPSLIRTRSNLAAIQVAIGRYHEAELLYRSDLSAKREDDKTHPLNLATTLNNLAEVIRSQGRFDESRELFFEALDLREQHLSDDHPMLAQSLSNLGNVHLLKCDTRRAEPLFQRALQIRNTSLAANHPHVVTTLVCLSQIRVLEGKNSDARDLLERALEMSEQSQGTKHPVYASILTRLGRVYLAMESIARAELSHLKAKAILDQEVTPNHRFVGEALLGLGELRQSEERFEEAFPLLEQAFEVLERTDPGLRIEKGQLLFLLGRNHKQRGERDLATQRFEDALAVWKPLLGTRHRSVAECESELGQHYSTVGRHAEALSLLEPLRDESCPHEWSVEERVAMASAYADASAGLGDFDLAESLLNEQLSMIETLEKSEPLKLAVLSNLAGVKYLQGEMQAAQPIIGTCIELSEQLNGSDHPTTAKHRENLAGMYFSTGRVEEAKILINSVLDTFRSHYGDDHEKVRTAMENYAHLLRSSKHESEAEQWEDQLQGLDDRGSHVLDDLF